MFDQLGSNQFYFVGLSKQPVNFKHCWQLFNYHVDGLFRKSWHHPDEQRDAPTSTQTYRNTLADPSSAGGTMALSDELHISFARKAVCGTAGSHEQSKQRSGSHSCCAVASRQDARPWNHVHSFVSHHAKDSFSEDSSEEEKSGALRG